MNTPKEKALYLSYVLADLLITNLEVVLVEKIDAKERDIGRLRDKIVKLRSATKNAFTTMERNVGSDIKLIKQDINTILEELWN